MNNKSLKNLIVIAVFVFFAFTANNALAYVPDYGYQGSNQNYNYTSYTNPYIGQYSYDYNTYQQPVQQYAQPQYNYGQQMPITYVAAQPKVQYITAPQPQTQIIYVEQPATTTQIKYVPAQQTTQYVAQPAQQTVQYVAQPAQQTVQYVTQPTQYVTTGNTQGASVINSTNTKVVKNTGVTGNTGQYISYDAYSNQNMMGASAYGAYTQPVVYDTNGVTALSVGGSGGFMPTSVFQWFLLIILILAIVIIARMISKTFMKDNHTTIVH